MTIQQHYFDIQMNEYQNQIDNTDWVLMDLARLLDEASIKNWNL